MAVKRLDWCIQYVQAKSDNVELVDEDSCAFMLVQTQNFGMIRKKVAEADELLANFGMIRKKVAEADELLEIGRAHV